jgi:uncharacterized protein YjbI with pentapeptide repeats
MGNIYEWADSRTRMIRFPLVVMIIMIATSAYAQEAEIPEEVRMLGDCSGCSFDGADFSDRKLTGINLEESRLNAVDFHAAQLNIAIFNGSVLRDVNFASANLRGASFTGSTLIDVSFEGADLRGAVF